MRARLRPTVTVTGEVEATFRSNCTSTERMPGLPVALRPSHSRACAGMCSQAPRLRTKAGISWPEAFVTFTFAAFTSVPGASVANEPGIVAQRAPSGMAESITACLAALD